MATPDELTRLRSENQQLAAELARARAQLRKAYADRADIHARLRSATRFPASSPDHCSLLTDHSSLSQHTPSAGKP